MTIKRKEKTKQARDELFKSYVECENDEAKRVMELCSFLYTSGKTEEALGALEDRRRKLMGMADSFESQARKQGHPKAVMQSIKKLANSLRFIAFGVEQHAKTLRTGEVHLSPYSISQTASESGSD